MFHNAVDPTKLLEAFTVARVISREAFESAVRGPYSISHFDFPESTTSFEATNSRVRLRSTTLHHAHYTAPVRMKLGARPGLRQPVVLSGHSIVRDRQEIYENSAASALIFPADRECIVECGRGYAHLLIDYDEQAVLQHSLNLTGYTSAPLSRLNPRVADDASKLARLGSIAAVLAFNLTGVEKLNSPIIVELEQALLSAFLIENGLVSNVDVARLAGENAIRTMREYIHANWRRPLTVEDIAKVCNVSARSVFLQFNKVLGLSPMTYLRNVRLDESRRLLQDATEEPSVIRIALICGFSHVGHFAKRYKERFGELPSDTLRKAGRAHSLDEFP